MHNDLKESWQVSLTMVFDIERISPHQNTSLLATSKAHELADKISQINGISEIVLGDDYENYEDLAI